MIQDQWQQSADGYTLNGELTRETVPELWAFLQRWEPSQTELNVSLQYVQRVDSAGMVMLIHLIQHAKKSNCHIMLGFVPNQLQTLFQLSNIESVLLKNIKR
ncbi:lipid asymmetry maintenance protein MlaB [Vibrio sp. TH_r3]|uniref:STAS domain-containing protein n=1 Tax=Vibrio sp. TH_r3 TaxID=3082084 RepID=UPI002955C072|nr:lipid asymmetry maintenance protein MlaB [Vibrio sp. TH_r3]MDV7105930.1 lipid asymmetry maintenance protein MlaB [Vibrio sp. TH_r3]